MIDLDRLIAMRNKAQISKGATVSLEEARAWKDAADKYIDQLVADAPALLEATALMREAIRLYPFLEDPYGECYFCTGEFRRHDEGCLWGKLAALLGEEPPHA